MPDRDGEDLVPLLQVDLEILLAGAIST